ncbi:hypothetical protein [uncultured Paracoccus sp.]|uniref:hypothetical protein n=1 Tax=uncultured Paracoccus sp. TaxID=189685 RepID=UPI0025F80F51|nr:hypothetical protein [uncultured Paracoccus sp.]
MLDRRLHPSAHPLRPLRLAQTPVYVDRGYCPGGRWERILRTIHDQPLTETEILRAVHDGRYPRRIERRKIHAALIAMTRQGLTARLPGSPAPFTATAHGVRILHGEAA